MIRASDLATPAVWGRPSTTSPRLDAREASNWFDGVAPSEVRICADLNAASRGLSAEQHANLVLAHLCADRDGVE
jgi:hypothetical protein